MTYDPGIVVETQLFKDELSLTTSRVWQVAPLTRLGRRIVPGFLARGWHVRRPGETDTLAVVLHLLPHSICGRIVSAVPERVALDFTDRLLVVLPDVVVGVRGAEEHHAFGHLADVIVGTRPVRRCRSTPIPPDDLDNLASLAL